MVYLVEAELSEGIVLTPIEPYQGFRLRVCRPVGWSQEDQRRVCCYALKRLGTEYKVRQLADLARFIFPYSILPRKWRSTLFEHNAGPETKIVCTTLIADAFQAVKFPVLAIVSANKRGESRLFKRNAKLFAPSDFDISPYFQSSNFRSTQWRKINGVTSTTCLGPVMLRRLNQTLGLIHRIVRICRLMWLKTR